METIELLKKQNKELFDHIVQQNQLIKDMKDVLRFCARTDVGTYYQSESAREMLLNNTKLVWSHCNPDGTLTKDQRDWIFLCAEGRKKGGGKRALRELDKYEKELLGL